ncbi:signal peptide peptidase SppA [soil metagenome]
MRAASLLDRVIHTAGHRRAREPVLLELDLSRGLLETQPADPLAAVRSRGVPTLRGLVDQLRRAGEDDRVVGLVTQVSASTLPPSQADELADAVESFGATGRTTVAWTESFGEVGIGTTAYRLAVAFDTIWMQPSGELGLTGVTGRGLFLRGLLDRLGVEPQFGQRHEYKNAADLFMRESMSDAQREALQQLADSVLDGVVSAAARRRDRTVQQVRDAVDAAPLSARDAVEAGLVDRLGYRDEVYDDLRERLGDDGRLTLRYVQRWSPTGPALARQRLQQRHRPVVACVCVLGGIGLGRSGSSPMGGRHAGSDTVCAALRAVGRRDDVRAVVLRVVSPGGSYVASDAVRREVLQLRESGRPVVASMGSVAASGGYFVAMGCDEIVATASTITGSIGVLAGKLVTGAALGRVGIGVEPIGAGRQSTMFSPDVPFSDEQWQRLDSWLDQVYDDFTHKAADDRGVAHAELEPLARGRVWTGADALERGLVDRLGGFRTAVERAAQRAGLSADAIQVQTVPHPNPLERLRLPESSESATALAPVGLLAVSGGAAGMSGLEGLLVRAGLMSHGVLSLPGPLAGGLELRR